MTLQDIKNLPQGALIAFNSSKASAIMKKIGLSRVEFRSNQLQLEYSGVAIMEAPAYFGLRGVDASTIPIDETSAEAYYSQDPQDFHMAKIQIISKIMGPKETKVMEWSIT